MAIIKDAGPVSLNLMKILPTEHQEVAVKRLQIWQVHLQTADLRKYLILYLMACFKALATELMEREDTKRQELKDELKAELRGEFQGKLDKNDAKITKMEATISDLTKKV